MLKEKSEIMVTNGNMYKTMKRSSLYVVSWFKEEHAEKKEKAIVIQSTYAVTSIFDFTEAAPVPAAALARQHLNLQW